MTVFLPGRSGNRHAFLGLVYLLNGDVHITRSLDAEALQSMGVKAFQDLPDHQKTLENNFLTSQEHSVIQELIDLELTVLRSDLLPEIFFPMFDEFFPGINDELYKESDL